MGADWPDRTGRECVGSVECIEHWVMNVALAVNVDRAATAFRGIIIYRPEFYFLLFGKNKRTNLRLQIDQDAGTAGLSVELTADGKNRIAQSFGIDPFPVHAPEIMIIGIDLRTVRV